MRRSRSHSVHRLFAIDATPSRPTLLGGPRRPIELSSARRERHKHCNPAIFQIQKRSQLGENHAGSYVRRMRERPAVASGHAPGTHGGRVHCARVLRTELHLAVQVLLVSRRPLLPYMPQHRLQLPPRMPAHADQRVQ
jgi:hypothetical protein